MKLVIIGGSSGTGARLADLALAQGHDVSIVSRSGSTTADQRITQIMGDASDAQFVTEAISGADAVVVTVGGSKGSKDSRTRVTRAVVEAMEQAMEQAGPSRLLVQSSLGVNESISQLPGVIGFITKLLLGQALADHASQEDVVRASSLDWNIVRPTGLSNKPSTGSWTALEVGEAGRFTGTVSRSDLAAFMLQISTDPGVTHKAFGVSSR